jgi:hypothetical protein
MSPRRPVFLFSPTPPNFPRPPSPPSPADKNISPTSTFIPNLFSIATQPVKAPEDVLLEHFPSHCKLLYVFPCTSTLSLMSSSVRVAADTSDSPYARSSPPSSQHSFVDRTTHTTHNSSSSTSSAWKRALSSNNTVTAMDVKDSLFYTGRSATAETVSQIVQELHERETDASSPPVTSSSSLATSSFPVTSSVFDVGPAKTRELVYESQALETKGSLPIWQHVLERAIGTLLNVSCLTTTRHTPLSHPGEGHGVRNITFTLCMMLDFVTLVSRIALLAVYLVVDTIEQRTQCISIFIVMSMFTVFHIAPLVREAVWFGKRCRSQLQRVLRLRDRLHYLQMTTAGHSRISAYDYVSKLAKKVADMELTNEVLTRESLAQALAGTGASDYAAKSAGRARSGSAVVRESTRNEHLKVKYAVQSNILRNSITVACGILLPCLLAVGLLVDNRGSFIPAGSSEAARTVLFIQLAVSLLILMAFTVIFTHIFILEAVNDCSAHSRLIAAFLHSAGAITHTDVVIKGHRAPDFDEASELSSENLKITIDSGEDMETVFAIYEFLFQYVQMRASFHCSFFGFVVVVEIVLSATFLMGSVRGWAFSAALKLTMLGVAALGTTALVYALRPVIKTSRMLQEDWLNFLVDRRLLLMCEMSSSFNSCLEEGGRRAFEDQIRACEARAEKQKTNPSHLKILGVVATTGSLAKFTGMIIGSLLSGLMRQANDV